MKGYRRIAMVLLAAGSLSMAAGAGSGAALAQAAEAPSAALTLGGLTLENGGGPLNLAEDAPSLSLGLAPSQDTLPLSARPRALAGSGTEIADNAGSLGTRLTIGQPLGLDFLGGSVDWQAAATLEQAPQGGDAYGLSLSLGSMAESPAAPPSDLRIGLTYGREPELDEHGVVLDFSYSF
ncbi:hypothetical protein C882_0046 [Caenispirillum salinarum AK4]|uniref:Uncharacterized protein n=1 Tax=Caenispirillum salinarum AK4 TaxID=1238182 RepID=K9GVE5_9PROT|nr:hypothetical protein [Caenispirillum salinarum]EKV29965.1 hypothetical protein C882_0046 [Caenispirillum salinarum AK4]